ncbi:MAG: outer membrane lipoprotein-sorting protein [Thermodesulfobacteriota bacterium]
MTAKEILDYVDDLFRGLSSQGRMTMIIVTENWDRTLDLEWWSKGKEMTLIRILAPLKEKDTATLRVGDEIWNFLPKTNKTIKLPSSMMSGSWMGSHFTNDDLVKESRMAEDFTFETTFEGRRDGLEVLEITCHPKPEAAVVWGKVVETVRTGDFLPVDIKYYDEDLNLARTMVFTELGDLGGRTLPRRMTVHPADKPGEKTEVYYREMTFDPDIPDDFFSLRNLRK